MLFNLYCASCVNYQVKLLISTGSPSSVKTVNTRLLSICPPHSFTRLPRPIGERAFWKASEWRHWLLFYWLPCIDGLLTQRHFNHLCKLVEAVWILLGTSLTVSDIRRAGKDDLFYHTFVLPGFSSSACIHFWYSDGLPQKERNMFKITGLNILYLLAQPNAKRADEGRQGLWILSIKRGNPHRVVKRRVSLKSMKQTHITYNYSTSANSSEKAFRNLLSSMVPPAFDGTPFQSITVRGKQLIFKVIHGTKVVILEES